MKKILVTGGSGFIGRHVVAELIRLGHQPTLISRSSSIQNKFAPCIQFDILQDNPDVLFSNNAFDIVIHLAWETTHGQFWSSPNNLDWVGASCRFIRSFHQSGGTRFLGVGTCFEYHLSENAPLIEGITPLEPRTLYGVSKDATRRILEAYAAESGVSFAWARMFHLFGEGEASARLVPSVISALQRGDIAKTTSGSQLRNFMHAADAGRALATIAVSDLSGVVNVGADENTTIADLVRLIGNTLNRSEQLGIGALPMRPGEPQTIIPQLDRLHGLGFKPYFNLASGISDVVLQFSKRSED